ncbi:MAG TPA: hypothetical protein VJZ02_06255 [Candidatus Brocadiales bacterium]|nr:hypothetical protein [Candidatus Brocadiales bacterium]
MEVNIISWLTEYISPPVVIFIGAIIAATGAMWASSKQAQFERELRAKSDEIADLNRTIVASVTGGDSFCYLVFSLGDGTTNMPPLVLVHQGKYPLYDVGIRIVDLEKFDRVKGEAFTLDRMDKTDTLFSIGSVSPGQTCIINRGCQLPNADQQRYNIFISARNGFVNQLTRLQRVNNRWKSATKVIREDYVLGKQVVLLEEVDKEFPRDKTGQVQW